MFLFLVLVLLCDGVISRECIPLVLPSPVDSYIQITEYRIHELYCDIINMLGGPSLADLGDATDKLRSIRCLNRRGKEVLTRMEELDKKLDELQSSVDNY